MALLESRSFRPFKSSEEYLYAMKEDLAEWLNFLYPELYLNVNNLMDRLDTGVALCKHANNVRKYAEDYVNRRHAAGKTNVHSVASSLLHLQNVRFLPGAKCGTFFARDNVSNFISWCRHGLGVYECLLFETDDLIMRKNEKHVILCLLEVARRGFKLGMPAPMLVHLEREIDREIAADKRRLKFGGNQDYYDDTDDQESDLSDSEDCVEYGPIPQIVTNDLKSLDEMVRDEIEKCHCPTQFPMIRVSEGKYRIGDTKVLIFVRVLRSHVMVRVGGGWDTLSHYLDKHDPCRCKTAHRTAVSSKLTGVKSGSQVLELTHAQVHYERSPPRTRKSSTSSNSSANGVSLNQLSSIKGSRNRSRSPSLCINDSRSRSPTPALKKTLSNPSRRSFRSRSPSVHKSRPNSPTSTLKKTLSNPTRRSFRSRSPSVHKSRPNTPVANRKHKSEKKQDFVEANKDYSLKIDGVQLVPRSSRSPSRDKYTYEVIDKHTVETEDDNKVDCSSISKVSDNFGNHNHIEMTTKEPAQCSKVEVLLSGVDSTPTCKISDNFNSCPLTMNSDVRRIVSVNDLDLVIKKEQNDSGSEVSDEGYKSLGLVTTPPDNPYPSGAPHPLGSPIHRNTRPGRSRSAGGTESPSPQHSPFHRNTKVNKSARQSPTHKPIKTNTTNNNYNTWTTSTSPLSCKNGKKRPTISEDTFCKQVTQIMQQYAAMIPSPRKDTKPDSKISTRIPAPIQKRDIVP